MKKLLIIFLLIAIFSFAGYPSRANAVSQDKLDELQAQLNYIAQMLYSLKEQVAKLIKSPEPSYIKILDKDLIIQKVEQGKEFLFRMENKDEHGFYKRYDTINDSFENRVHTIYSASIIYTFLYIYDYDQDERILENLPDWGNFLLSMQNSEQGRRAYGAFHYSFYLDSQEKEQRFPVGTSALSIFTLLRLYEITGEQKYLESAKLAGDWLMTMQKENGAIKSYGRYEDNKWLMGTKESLLYNGQVLSSLSKLYGATKEQKYYDTAERIAKYFTEKYGQEQGYIEGDYRKKNPISNSWVVMSLLDFYKVSHDDYYKNIIYELSDLILKNQITDEDDFEDYGRWKGAYSTSGIGWISEVMTEMYRFCDKENRTDCNKYKDAVVKAIRWLIQNTYSKENSSSLENPERAIGGVFWSSYNKYVRTDSVCHALNGYTRIINALDEGILLSLP